MFVANLSLKQVSHFTCLAGPRKFKLKPYCLQSIIRSYILYLEERNWDRAPVQLLFSIVHDNDGVISQFSSSQVIPDSKFTYRVVSSLPQVPCSPNSMSTSTSTHSSISHALSGSGSLSPHHFQFPDVFTYECAALEYSFFEVVSATRACRCHILSTTKIFITVT